MVGWHYQLNGHEFEQTPEGSEGQLSFACCMQSMRLKRVEPDLVTEQQLLYLKFCYECRSHVVFVPQ